MEQIVSVFPMYFLTYFPFVHLFPGNLFPSKNVNLPVIFHRTEKRLQTHAPTSQPTFKCNPFTYFLSKRLNRLGNNIKRSVLPLNI